MLKKFIFMEDWMKAHYNRRIFGTTDVIHLSPFLRYGHLKMTYQGSCAKKWFVTFNNSLPNLNGA